MRLPPLFLQVEKVPRVFPYSLTPGPGIAILVDIQLTTYLKAWVCIRPARE